MGIVFEIPSLSIHLCCPTAGIWNGLVVICSNLEYDFMVSF